MADRRRRSPEGSSRTKGKEPTRSAYDEPPRMPIYEQPRMRPGAEEVVYSSSSSSSSSYIDISRKWPRRFGLRAFFTAPSERRRVRRRKSTRLFKIGNSSSSSVNSDLAYGTGFIKRPKRRSVRGRNGREFRGGERREGYSDRESNNGRSRVERRDEAGRPPLGRAQTEAEILAIGAGLAKLARDQNRRDLREARNGSRPDLSAGISAPGYNGQGTSRGLVNSRPSHGADAADDDGWESASDSEESVDSRLAFGEEGTSSGGFFGLFGRKKHRPLSRKGTVVDPRLFGPNNTLHGIVTEPVGFGEVTPWASTSDFGQQFSDGPGIGPSHTGSQASLQRVFPVPTSDPGRFDARAASVISGPGPEPMVVSRPGPIPIQQPQPVAPISQSVYGRSESDRVSKRDPASGRGKSLAEAALVGVAGAAVGAAIASSRDDRKRREEDELDEKTRLRRRDSERASKDDRRRGEREKRSSPEREERKERRREKDDSSRVSSDKRRERRKDETRGERDERRERRKDDHRDEMDEKREKRRSERFDERGEARRTKSETAVPTTGIDPFQYQLADEQVPDDAFPAPKREPTTVAAAPAVHYVTVEREPDFSRIAPIRDARTPDFMHMHRQNPPRYIDKDQGEQDQILRDRALEEAKEIYEETTHSTAPIAAAAFGAAVAAVHHADAERESRSDKRREERRGERRTENDDYDSKSRDEKSGKEKDPIQEEADRAYREIIMARKIASQVIRSRTPSPNRSVTEKYIEEEEEVEEPIRIVTPPGMEDKKKAGPYDAPNADFKPDYVLEDPAELRNFKVSQTNAARVDAEGPYLKRDPDADRPRPFLNLVRPTPVPSPVPEKQAARSEPAKTSKSTDREEQKRSAASEVQSKDEAVDSPTSSTVSKGVTWGENETKHYEVESPAEHRDEFVSKSDYQAREAQEEPQPAAKPSPKSTGWGAIAAGIIGAGVGAAAANSSDTTKTSKSKEDEPKDAPYEYRGVVVEPESPSQSSDQRDAPPTGPKPSKFETSRVPGAFDDDIDFTATVAAGLQDSGFDPNIVIDDPSFRRRNSPPGSNDFKPYRAPFAETVSDLGSFPSDMSGARDGQGFIIGEVASTPQDWRSVSPPRDDETPIKLSKKEQKKRDKEKRRSGDVTPLEVSSATPDVVEEPQNYYEPPLSKKEQKKRDKLSRQDSQGDDITPSVAEGLVEEPESYFETPKKSKKKSKKGTSSVDDYTEESPRDGRKVSVPVDAFDDLRNDDEEWADAKKSKKSKRDSGRYDSPPRSVPSSEVASELSRSSSKKSKDKSKRKSEQYDPNPTEISLPASTPSEISRDGDYDDSRGSRKSSTRDNGIFNSADRGDSRSVVSADTSRYDDDEPRKSKKSRSSTKDDYDDSRSVVSAPAGDDYDDSKRSKKRDKDKEKEKDKKSGGGFFGLFGSKSDVGARDEPKDNFEEPKKKKKSKRNSLADSSIYGDEGAQSVGDVSRPVPNGNGDRNGSYNSQDEENDDDRTEKSKTRSRSQSSSSKKDSFLGNAGTLGAGVGIAGAAVAIAAQQYQQSKAANAKSRDTIEREQRKSSPRSILPHEIYDPEITERQFRPSIDPQYGDLLPLPPSNPVSPNVDPIDDLPELPESRPDTPEPERIAREKSLSTVRKNIQETPMKSPSQSAVPLNFIMRNRSQPASPRFVRSSPLQSPSTTAEDSLSFPRSRPRPTSWDSTKEYKPLYLVESHRRGSSAQLEMEDELPALPPSQQTSRSSSQLELDELGKIPLSIDTNLASSRAIEEPLGSEQSTPKAKFMTRDGRDINDSIEHVYPATEFDSQPEQMPSSPEPKSRSEGHLAEAAATAGLISTLGYFASSPSHPKTKESFLDELPSVTQQPSPVEPMTKDRSSYLLHSSPMTTRFEEFESADRELDSPSWKQKSSRSSSTAMESIQEREANDVFKSPKAIPETPKFEEIMDNLSISPRDDLADQEKARESLDQQSIDFQDRELAAPTPAEAEPTDEFTFTKPKKDKKKAKKEKGLSRSSTQDDFVIPESGNTVEEMTGPAEAGPADDEIFVPKSKKDKKKDKKSKLASIWNPDEDESITQQIEEPLLDSAREVPADTAVPADLEGFQEFSTPKSKKDKKGKRKSVVTWDSDAFDSTQQMTEQPQEEPTRVIHEDVSTPIGDEPVDEVSTSKSKKKKKKDKKAASTWEPEEESLSQPLPESAIEENQEVVEKTAFLPEAEPLEKLSAKSKKDKKKDKKSSKSTSAVGSEQDETEAQAAETRADLIKEPVSNLHEPQFLRDTMITESTGDLIASQAPEDQEEVAESESISKDSQPVPPGYLTESQAPELQERVAQLQSISRESQPEPTADLTISQTPVDQERVIELESISRESQPAPTEDLIESRTPEDQPRDAGLESISTHSRPEVTEDLIESQAHKDQEEVAESEYVSGGSQPGPSGNLIKSKVPEDQEGSAEPEQISKDSLPDTNDDLIEGRAPENQEMVADLEPTSKESQQETNDDIARDAPVEPVEDVFIARKTKKKDKKKGKLATIWQEEGESVASELISVDTQEDGTRDALEAALPSNDFLVTKSKNGKKDKKKRVESASTREPEEDPPSTRLTQEVDDIQDFEAATFKKGKKKKKASSFVADDELASASRQAPFENLVAQDDRSPTDILKSEEGQVPAQSLSTTEQVKTRESENIFDAPESLSSKPTPMGGPGAWPITPATPWIGGEVPDPSSKEYFPSTETSHSPLNREIPEESQSKSYFPSVEIVLPIVAAGAALLGAKSLKEDSSPPSEELTKDATTSKAKDLQERSVPQSDLRPTPDGFSAGYDNDQLSLAKRLQEEFSSGSRKSKKDRKRQSLPPTPARELSRSRTVEETPESHPRARSLSIGPSAADRAGSTPLTGARENIYSEEQLELARQLKADFESGGKKSKKDKKRQGLSRSSTQDDTGFDRDMENSQVTIPKSSQDFQDPETSETVPKGDGFAAGYEEDQLSLARQLQAEFGKKSKKDKKRRSTSQTPQDQEPRDDFIDEPSRAPISNIMEQDNTAQAPESNPQDMARDGLALGYSEEQAELARQLKEEFGSSSKKGKKDKKDKKRRSTSQTPLNQEPQDDYFGGSLPAPVSDEIEQEQQGPIPESNADTGPVGETLPVRYKEEQLELARQLQEEFGYGSKKSKKDKKDKKRSILLQSNNKGDDFSSDAQSRDTESGNIEAQPPEIAESTNEPEDELAFPTKKSKKDKKDKKRGSLLRTNTEDDFSIDAQPRDGDYSEAQQELAGASTTNEPQDDSTLITKKSKKDKKGKKRASLLPENQGDDAPSKPTSQPADEEDKTPDLEGSELAPVVEATSEPVQQEDDFAFTTKSKKGKKGKKRDSMLQISAEDDLPSETQLDSQDQSRDIEPPAQPEFAQEFSAEPEEEFTSLTKKSKKGKKDQKRGSMLQTSPENDLPDETRFDSQDQSRDVEAPAQPNFAQEFSAEPEEFTSLTKKSKKGKKDKKRGSMLQDSPENNLLDETRFDSQHPSRDVEDPAQSDIAQDFSAEPEEFTSLTKKSKKDKKGKKRYNVLETASENDLPSETPSDSQDLTRDADAPSRPDLTQKFSDEPIAAGPGDESSTLTKKFEDDEKGNKEYYATQSAADDNTPSDNFGKEVEALHAAHAQDPSHIDLEPAQPAPEDDWSVPVKEDEDLHAIQENVSQEINLEPAHAATGEDSSVPEKQDEALYNTRDVQSEGIDLELAQTLAENILSDPEKEDEALHATHAKDPSDIDLEPAQPALEDDWRVPVKEDEDLYAIQEAESREIDLEPAQVAPEEDWSVPAESEKERKEDLQSAIAPIAQEEPFEQQGFEAKSAQPEEELPTPNPTSEVVEKPTDDFTFSSKKSKKDKKKRGNLLRSSTFDETPEEQFKEIQPQLESGEVVNEVDSAFATYAPLTDNQDEAFEYSTKKSKKDKKKRGTQLRSSTSDEIPEDQVKEGKIQPELGGEDLVYDDSDKVVPSPDDQGEEFQYSSKKSKKDRKKRGSLLRSSTSDEAPAEQVLKSDTQPELESRELGNDAGVSVAPSADNQDDDFGSSSKRSKKDKKRRKSSQPTPTLEELPKGLEEPPKQDDAVASSVPEGFRPLILETDPSPETVIPGSTFNEETLLPQPSNIMAERDAPEATLEKDEPLRQSSNIKIQQDIPESTAHGTALDQGTSTNQPEEGPPPSGPPDIFHDFAFTTKKSKKDKKKRKDSAKDDSEEGSGLSTPLDPMAETKSIVEPAVATDSENAIAIDEPLGRVPDAVAFPAPEQQVEEEPTDEWSSSSVKKSKKEKKRKGSSRTASTTASITPLEPILEPEVADQERQPPTLDFLEENRFAEEPLSRTVEEPLSQVSEHPTSITEEILETPADEGPSYSAKKSKKDKKKSKGLSQSQSSEPSDISIPIVKPKMSIVDPLLPTENVPEEPPASALPRDPEYPKDIATKDESAEPVDEWASPSTKKSKKDKKKRKSGLSTPAEPMEETSTFESEKAVAEVSHQPAQAEAEAPIIQEPAFKVVDNLTEISEARVQNFQDSEPASQESKDEEITDEAFSFATKRSKKEKKGAKKSSGASESRARRSILSETLPREIGDETEPPLLPEQVVSSPVAMEDDDFANTDQLHRYDEPAGDDKSKVALGGGIRTSSKKDKRKRQSTIADISLDAMDASIPPLTSWADEVEEAGIERETPVIQDIAKDETLSHIASTTESAAADDFFRPTKKGKKGKKRVSEPASSVESSRPATSSGMPKDEVVDDHNNIAILAATGAALAGAGLLKKADEIRESPSKSTGATTPQRKLSKKEKKKKSIDLGLTPRDDIFDDPVLWEGAEPKAHEEIGHMDDDEAGSDGFGFASRDMDESMSTHEPYERREPTPRFEEHEHVEEVRPVSQAVEAQSAPGKPAHEQRTTTILPEDHQTATETAHESRDLQGENQDVRHEVDMFDQGPSMEEEHLTQLAPKTHDPKEAIQHREDVQTIGQPQFSAPSRSMADTPPSDKGVSFEEPLPIIHEHISTASGASDEEVHGDRSLAFEDIADNSPARPLSTSKFGRTSFGDLPVVHEESEPLPPHHHDFEANRDSAFVTGSPIPRHQFTDDHEHVRDSGVHLRDISPAERVPTHVASTDDALARLSWPQVDDETETVDLSRSQRHVIKTSTEHQHQERIPSETRDSHSLGSHQEKGDKSANFNQSQRSAEEKSTHHEKPLTSRELFPYYKSTEERSVKHHYDGTSREDHPSHHSSEEKHTDLHRVPTIHGSRKPREDSLVKQRLQRFESPDLQRPVMPKEDKYAELTSSQKPKAERPQGMSEMETGAAVAGATLGFAAARKLSQEQRPASAQSQRSSPNINRLRTPDPKRPDSGASNRSGTPPLRRSDRKLSGDLRSLSQRSKPDLAKEAELAALATSTSASQVHTPNPTANEGRVRAKDMATDVYDGLGEGRMGSPRSPTRPHSMRRRQSMQVLDLESKVEQLIAENRMLAEAKVQAEQTLASTSHASASLIEKDAEIDSLKRTLDWLQNEVTRLTQVNEGLNSAHVELGRQHNDRYGALESQHAQATRELQEVRDAHDNLSAGVEGIVQNQVQGAVREKDQEIAQLRAELDAAKEQIREMQRQILASKANEVDFLTVRDEDYFDNACQSLCQHVQQWVLRFSKFSDMRACRLSSEINNEKTLDRLDNAILDGSDVDTYLADRIKRRDVFMSMTMNMVWEFIFTRYLFGMDREQRQKLKSLEKTLSEVGPGAAVHHWRATTLTLLSKRKAFVQQREQDTQAVVHAIIETLSEILPPPSHLETQIEEQLTRVMKEAVDLSIEMRTQRAEYMMLPPLLPEYDANGDLASKVSFNAALMNERSGDTVSNEELEQQKAVVRVVLFPLVVKKGDDRGEGDEEIVVCPAQVLVAKPKKTVRVFSPGSVQGHSRISLQSSMPAEHGEGSVI